MKIAHGMTYLVSLKLPEQAAFPRFPDMELVELAGSFAILLHGMFRIHL